MPCFAWSQEECVPFNPKEAFSLESTIEVIGTLRKNSFFANEEDIIGEFGEVSFVLMSTTPLMIDAGGWDVPVACSFSQFTLHLSQEQIKQVLEIYARGNQVQVVGQVGLAESSIEEAGNATLRNVSIQILK